MKFQDKLKEGSSYFIVNPTIGRQPANFVLRDQLQKITFLNSTTLINSPTFSGSTFGFSFVDYGTIKSSDFPLSRSVGQYIF